MTNFGWRRRQNKSWGRAYTFNTAFAFVLNLIGDWYAAGVKELSPGDLSDFGAGFAIEDWKGAKR
jgi:hypothetical protein